MVFRLVRKLKTCDSCGLAKTKSKHACAVCNSLKKDSAVGDRLFVDINGPFPLT